jgi:hypothetical protein
MYLKPLHLPKATILVLEADPFLRTGLCSLLTAAGYLLAEGTGGANPAGRVDLVLAGMGSDKNLEPALDLLDRAVPVILLVDGTTWSALAFFDAANALGAAAVLPRPFSRSALLCLVAKVLSQPVRDAAKPDPADLPTLAELLIHLDNPNFV